MSLGTRSSATARRSAARQALRQRAALLRQHRTGTGEARIPTICQVDYQSRPLGDRAQLTQREANSTLTKHCHCIAGRDIRKNASRRQNGYWLVLQVNQNSSGGMNHPFFSVSMNCGRHAEGDRQTQGTPHTFSASSSACFSSVDMKSSSAGRITLLMNSSVLGARVLGHVGRQRLQDVLGQVPHGVLRQAARVPCWPAPRSRPSPAAARGSTLVSETSLALGPTSRLAA